MSFALAVYILKYFNVAWPLLTWLISIYNLHISQLAVVTGLDSCFMGKEVIDTRKFNLSHFFHS